jgi:hypothetical protein
MLAVSRFRYDDNEVDLPQRELGACLALLQSFPGCVSGSVGRALDDPALWLLATSWRNVGAYRRAMSSYEVKADFMQVLGRAIDEPSAFEVLAGDGMTEANEAKPRGAG